MSRLRLYQSWDCTSNTTMMWHLHNVNKATLCSPPVVFDRWGEGGGGGEQWVAAGSRRWGVCVMVVYRPPCNPPCHFQAHSQAASRKHNSTV